MVRLYGVGITEDKYRTDDLNSLEGKNDSAYNVIDLYRSRYFV